MLTSNAANTLVSNQLDDVLRHLGHARAGSEDAIHQARIGIRRLFEELPLAVNRFDEDELEAVRRRLSRAARALSRVRDADIGQRLVDSMAARVLTSSTMLGRLRDVMMEHREKARRKAIKTLEAIDLSARPIATFCAVSASDASSSRSNHSLRSRPTATVTK